MSPYMGANLDADIGANLQHLRGAISQTALAKAMSALGHKWSQPTVVAIEKGERPLRYAEAMDVANILQAHVTAFAQTPPEVELTTSWREFDKARSALELSLAQYENARLAVKYAILDGLRAGLDLRPSEAREAWIHMTPEFVVAELRKSEHSPLLGDSSIADYKREVAILDRIRGVDQTEA